MWQFTIEVMNGKAFANYIIVAEYQARALKLAKDAFHQYCGRTGYCQVLQTNYSDETVEGIRQTLTGD